MAFLSLVGVISLVFGILFLTTPKMLRSWNSRFSRSFSFEERLFQLRIGVGVSLLGVSAFLFFIVYFLFKKYG